MVCKQNHKISHQVRQRVNAIRYQTLRLGKDTHSNLRHSEEDVYHDTDPGAFGRRSGSVNRYLRSLFMVMLNFRKLHFNCFRLVVGLGVAML
jgi:hypothetical protein